MALACSKLRSRNTSLFNSRFPAGASTERGSSVHEPCPLQRSTSRVQTRTWTDLTLPEQAPIHTLLPVVMVTLHHEVVSVVLKRRPLLFLRLFFIVLRCVGSSILVGRLFHLRLALLRMSVRGGCNSYSGGGDVMELGLAGRPAGRAGSSYYAGHDCLESTP